MKLPLPPVLAISDRSQARLALDEIAAALFAGGCRWFSLREKTLPAVERVTLLKRLVALARAYDAAILVHGDAKEAAAAGAAGVHLPAGGSARDARRILGEGALIGCSAHNESEIDTVAAAGADYVTLSPIFVSASKPGYGPALGLAALGVARPCPVLALGGIDPANAAACVAAGAAGVAVMGGAMTARDPQSYMAGLLRGFGAGLAARHGAGHS